MTELRHLKVVGIETALETTLSSATPDVEVPSEETAYRVQVPANGNRDFRPTRRHGHRAYQPSVSKRPGALSYLSVGRVVHLGAE